MFPIPIQYVLLFAVAINQIFGGISCCCLGRTLFSSTAVANGAAVKDLTGKLSSGGASRPIGKCPKCSARKSEQPACKNAAAMHAKPCPSINEDGQCRCLKVVINASVSNEPVTVDSETLARTVPVLDSVPKRDVLAAELQRFEVPIRFGGRSWQSIACVWKN